MGKSRLPLGQLHTLQLSPQQWVKVRRLARKKIENDMNTSRWRRFFNDKTPRKPAPGPEYGMIHKGARAFGDLCWWQQLKSAHHGGAKSLRAMQWQPGEWFEEDRLWIEEGFAHSSTSTNIVNRFRPPSRWKARQLNHVRVLCKADAFVFAITQGIQRGLI